MSSKTNKSYRKHRGVAINIETETSPNIRENKDGTQTVLKDIVINKWYTYPDSYRFDSVDECKECIDSVWNQMVASGDYEEGNKDDQTLFAEVMNSSD